VRCFAAFHLSHPVPVVFIFPVACSAEPGLDSTVGKIFVSLFGDNGSAFGFSGLNPS
jgi:hypothetical protein